MEYCTLVQQNIIDPSLESQYQRGSIFDTGLCQRLTTLTIW